MQIAIGSYKQYIYSIEIDTISKKIIKQNILKDVFKPAYIISSPSLSYIFQKDDSQFIAIGNQTLNINENACHLSFDSKNDLIYVSFYHDGLLKVLDKNNNNWHVKETHKYENFSHIHYAELIDSIDLVGVCDLGTDTLFLYKVQNKSLVKHTEYRFTAKSGPRHFVYKDNYIYVINELSHDLTVLQYKEDTLVFVQKITLAIGAGAAIRISNNKRFIYTSIRDCNYIYVFEINSDNSLKLRQKISTLGDHPRDINLILNDQFLLCANMHSNDLTLYKIIDGLLYVTDSNYAISAPATISHID